MPSKFLIQVVFHQWRCFNFRDPKWVEMVMHIHSAQIFSFAKYGIQGVCTRRGHTHNGTCNSILTCVQISGIISDLNAVNFSWKLKKIGECIYK